MVYIFLIVLTLLCLVPLDWTKVYFCRCVRWLNEGGWLINVELASPYPIYYTRHVSPFYCTCICNLGSRLGRRSMHRRSASYLGLARSCYARSIVRWVPQVTYIWYELLQIPSLERVYPSVSGFGWVRSVALIFVCHRLGFLLSGWTSRLDLQNTFESHIHVS